MSVSRVQASQLKPILDDARRGEVIVIAAPPGAGKSSAMYNAILNRTRGSLPFVHFDVLWAVQGIKKDASLGKEAVKKLKKLTREPEHFMSTRPVGVDILWGYEEAKAQGVRYEQQFTNSGRPPIHITSQALALFMLTQPQDPRWSEFLQTVQFVVIDEDPTAALIYSLAPEQGGSPVTQALLQHWADAGTAGNIESALLRTMQRAARQEFKSTVLSAVKGQPEEHSLTGKPFWLVLTEELRGTVPDEAAFKSHLTAAVKYLPDNLFSAFIEDLHHARRTHNSSHRFGLTWQLTPEGQVQDMAFRADVLRELPRDTPPIIVLDAYANPEVKQYELLFPNHAVRYVQDWPITPLDIEYLPDEFNPSRKEGRQKQGIIDRMNLVTGDQAGWRDAWMAEIGELTAGHPQGTLNLSYSNVVKYLQHPKRAQKMAEKWSWRLEQPLPADAVKFMWWFAGRGINDFEKSHVVAWHAPHRPSTYEHHVLAALAPRSPSQREHLRIHSFQAELLQMLHRGRQTNYVGDPAERPRVITLFHPGPLPQGWATLRPFIPRFKLTKWSRNPLHRVATAAIMKELVGLYGTVPHVCLTVLGLYEPTIREKDLQPAVLSALREKLRKASPRKYPLLTAWRQQAIGTDAPTVLQRRLGPFTPASGKDSDRVFEILREVLGSEHVRSHNIKVPVHFGKFTTRVYAETEAQAEKGLFKLLK